jgi:hypothetical protein
MISLLQPATPIEQRVLTVSGRVSRKVLNLVDAKLAEQEKAGMFWSYLISGYEDLRVGEQFTRVFDVTRSGILIPVAETTWTLRSWQKEPGNYYDLDFYQEHPHFKKMWGWKPLVLLEFGPGIPEVLEFSCYHEEDRWQLAHPTFRLSTEETYQALVEAEPSLGLAGVQEYLEALEEWTSGTNRGCSFHLRPIDSWQGPFEHLMYNPGLKHSLVEMEAVNWPESLRSCAKKYFRFTDTQVDKLFVLLDYMWHRPASRVWNVLVDSTVGGFYAIDHVDYVLEVEGQFYSFHLSWAD